MKKLSALVFLCIFIFGCATESSVLYERRYKRQLELEAKGSTKGFRTKVILGPDSITSIKEGIKLEVKHASMDFLDEFFKNEQLFGKLAGTNPYLPDTIVFFVKISNNSGRKIKIQPSEFVMIDDLSSQYEYLQPDYIVELFSSRGNIHAATKTTSDVAPGIYGAPFGVASTLAAGPARKRLFLLNQVVLRPGYVHDGIIYDGLIAFPRPNENAKNLRLILTDVKIDFTADDRPTQSLDFDYSFGVSFK